MKRRTHLSASQVVLIGSLLLFLFFGIFAALPGRSSSSVSPVSESSADEVRQSPREYDGNQLFWETPRQLNKLLVEVLPFVEQVSGYTFKTKPPLDVKRWSKEAFLEVMRKEAERVAPGLSESEMQTVLEAMYKEETCDAGVFGGRIVFFTHFPGGGRISRKIKAFYAVVLAHEAFHYLASQYSDVSEEEKTSGYRFLSEGMAEYYAYKAIAKMGYVLDSDSVSDKDPGFVLFYTRSKQWMNMCEAQGVIPKATWLHHGKDFTSMNDNLTVMGWANMLLKCPRCR